jgi:16S rRNA (uracil1498-N3)-methyltransferase
MNRIFIPYQIIIGNVIEITEQANYLLNVLRLRIGDQIIVFNGIDGEYISQIKEIKKKYISIEIIKKIRDQIFLEKLDIYLSIIKQDRMLLAIDLAVQLGATAIIPIITDYTQYKNLNYEKIEKRIIETVEQANRLDKTILKETITLKSLLDMDLKVIWANEREKIKTMNEVEIKLFNSILIGPEGGFSQNEQELLSKNPNFESVKISNSILRTETATSCAISQLNLLK